MGVRNKLKAQYSRILSSSFIKSILTLSSGVVVGQIINFFGMPFVGRIYTPAAMGDYTIITTNAGVIGSVACLGMMTVFMLPEKDEEARGLSRLVTYSTLLITTLAVFGLWFASAFYRIFHTEETPYAISLLVLWLNIVFNTVSNICYAYVNRRKLYRVMFWNPIITAGVNVGFGILFGLIGWGFVGYTAAHIASLFINIVHLAVHANPYERIDDPKYRCLPLLKSYRRFPIYQMPANLISSIDTQITIQTIEAVFSSAALGMYSMADRILSLPASLLATPVNRVYYREASERFNRGEDIGEFSFRILEANIKLAILPISLLMIFGEWIFALFLGEQWREAGTFASILGIYYLMQFCTKCLSGGFVIIRKNNISFLVAIFLVATRMLFSLIVYICSPTIISTMLILAIVFTAGSIISQGIFFKLTGFPLRRYISFLAIYVIVPACVCALIRGIIKTGLF